MTVFYIIKSNDIWSNNKDDVKTGVVYFTKYGLIPFAFLNAIRHIFFHGTILEVDNKNTQFFETECGGANLAVGVAALVNVSKGTSLDSYAGIYIIYATYLLVALLASLFVNFRGGMMIVGFMSISFVYLSTGIKCL